MSQRSSSLTPSQNERRERILAVTGELATDGGWDAVQMREVAQRADVALGTLYRYFPSKEFLLVSMMISEVQVLADRLAVRPPEGADPVDRVIDVLRRANRALQRRPQATIATIRALVSGNTDIAPAVKETTELMRRIISDALDDHSPTQNGATEASADPATTESSSELAISKASSQFVVAIELLSDVWLAALVAWISGVETDDSVLPKLEEATRILFV